VELRNCVLFQIQPSLLNSTIAFKTNDYGRARFTTIFFQVNNRLFTGAIFFTELIDV